VIEPLEGGAWMHMAELAAGLRDRGHDVEIAQPASELRGSQLRELGLTVHEIPLGTTMKAVVENVAGYRAIRALLRDGGYDLVHLHDLEAGVLGRIAARRTGVPCVFTPNGFSHRTEHLRGRPFGRGRRLFTLNLERALAPLAGRILAVSQDERDAAVADRVAKPERFAVVHYGVLDGSAGAEPDPELLAFAGGEPLVGFMTRMVTRKGVDVLLDALVLLRDRGTLPRVALVGNGDRYDDVAARVARDGLSERVDVRPFAPPVWPRLAAFDVFVLPTLWDVFPIAVLEAMAAGVPVIASDVHGLPESVDDGVTGLLLPAGDAAALADAIERLVDDAELRARMGAAGRDAYERRFQPSVMVEAIEAVYRDVVSTNPTL
jgi:glycosyltransferase involved in cell wall biosynthesis